MRVISLHARSSERSHIVAGLLLGLGAAAAAFAASEGAGQPSFGHYQPILDRMPFGTPPPNFGEAPVDPAAAQSEEAAKAEQQKLAQQINMSAVNITSDGKTAIGFTDLSEKPPINYYLLEGASAGGWKVLSANYDEETATIEKNAISITLKLGRGLVEPAPPSKTPAPPAPRAPPAAAPPNRLGALRPWGDRPTVPPAQAAGQPPEPGPAEMTVSYKERLQERQQQEEQARKAAAQKQQEQLAKIVQETTAKEFKRREEEAAAAAAEAVPAPDEQPVQPVQHVRSINEGNVE